MSYQLKISPRKMKNADYVGDVHDAIQQSFVDSSMTQQQLATKLGVDKSTVNKRLHGKANLTLRTIADFAWAFDKKIVFAFSDDDQPKERTNQYRKNSNFTDNWGDLETDSPMTTTGIRAK